MKVCINHQITVFPIGKEHQANTDDIEINRIGNGNNLENFIITNSRLLQPDLNFSSILFP